jgi:hypothetical protein
MRRRPLIEERLIACVGWEATAGAPETAKIGAAELATYVVEKGRPLFNLAEEGRHV